MDGQIAEIGLISSTYWPAKKSFHLNYLWPIKISTYKHFLYSVLQIFVL